jgi:hypothetical protein
VSENVLTVRIDPPLQVAVVQAIQEGINALDQGLGIPHATVCQRLANKVEAKS